MAQNQIAQKAFSTPFGFVTFTAESEKITSVELCKKVRDTSTAKVFDLVERQLEQYLKGKLSRFTIPLQVSGTPFQLSVWRAIAQVPFGKTLSYGDIARLIGKPQASRAVGAAVGANPTPLIVGCHRVLGSSGAITGYSGGKGIFTKRQLLSHEEIEFFG